MHTVQHMPSKYRLPFNNLDAIAIICCVFIYLFILLFRAIPAAYGGSHARGLIGAVTTGLCQRHSNAGFEPRLRTTPQLMATLDP